jgi:hypothetical protein
MAKAASVEWVTTGIHVPREMLELLRRVAAKRANQWRPRLCLGRASGAGAGERGRVGARGGAVVGSLPRHLGRAPQRFLAAPMEDLFLSRWTMQGRTPDNSDLGGAIWAWRPQLGGWPFCYPGRI